MRTLCKVGELLRYQRPEDFTDTIAICLFVRDIFALQSRGLNLLGQPIKGRNDLLPEHLLPDGVDALLDEDEGRIFGATVYAEFTATHQGWTRTVLQWPTGLEEAA